MALTQNILQNPKRIALATVFIFITISSKVTCSNILIFHTSGTASHRTAIWPIVTKLADSGHNITYVFPISRRPGSHPRVEELMPSKMFAVVDSFVGDFDINIRLNNTQDQWLRDIFTVNVQFCEAFYDSPETKEWLSRPNLHYDLVILDGPGFGFCSYGLVHKFKAKHIIMNPVTMPFYWDSFGIVPESSSIPEWKFSQRPADMETLWSRTLTTVAPLLLHWSYLGTLKNMEDIVRQKLNAPDMPSFQEIEQNTSLVLHNAYFIEEYPMSLPPMYVSYSGLLCTKKSVQERKALPKELEAFVSGADVDGIVYVSFGSSVVASAMPEHIRNNIMSAFAAFPKLRFLWRWTGPIPKDTPKNVLLQSWFPQLDVLAHPKTKVFILQAGRPSAQEALCYGVPMIAVPIFGDQDFNAFRLESIGAAKLVMIEELTTQTLANGIQEVIRTDKYKKRMVELSLMYRDRPMDPVDYVYFWIQYVLKYDTSLLKPLAMKQNWWQRRLLDVYALILAVISTVLIIILVSTYVIAKYVSRLVFGSSQASKKLKTK